MSYQHHASDRNEIIAEINSLRAAIESVFSTLQKVHQWAIKGHHDGAYNDQALYEICQILESYADNVTDTHLINWMQDQAEIGCITTGFEMNGGVFVSLDLVGETQRSGREVNTVRDGLTKLFLEDLAAAGSEDINHAKF